MTTNVIDLINGAVASDSRWSISGKSFIFFYDDPGFEKILPLAGSVCVFAGNGFLIEEWKKWFQTKPKDRTGHPPTSLSLPNGTQSITINLVIKKTKKVRFSRGSAERFGNEAVFAGTGTYPAIASWTLEKDAIKAVENAILSDHFSGGTIKHLAFNGVPHNLNQSRSIQEVNKLIGEEGTVMFLDNSKLCMPVAEAKLQDTSVAQMADAIAAGSVNASAPCASMYTDWTAEELSDLGDALDEILALEE